LVAHIQFFFGLRLRELIEDSSKFKGYKKF